MKICVGWFLRAPAYEIKYRLAYHCWDHTEHVSWLRMRLAEMRGGQPDASVSPALRKLMDEALHAPDTDSMLRGLYGVIKRALLKTYKEHLAKADPAANACEIRLIERIVPEIEAQLRWYDSLNLEGNPCEWQEYLRGLLRACGGISGSELSAAATMSKEGAQLASVVSQRQSTRFERPQTIHFDARICKAPLTPYAVRQQADKRTATVEQFKVFFNELYAAALLATILFDSFDDDNPWEYYVDFSHHFWDEARHSEFGAVRLKELGEEPSVCNQELFEQTEGLPVLHRICYLTMRQKR